MTADALQSPAIPVRAQAAIVERIEDPASFHALRDAWDDLLVESPADCLFLTWEWLSTWWKHLAGHRRLRLLLVRCNGNLVAIAPLARRPPAWHRLLPFPALEFLGTGTVGSDYLDVIVRRGREAEALTALAEAIARSQLPLELGHVKRAASFAAALAGRLRQEHWTMNKTPMTVCPVVSLTGHTWETYLASLGAAHRYNFKRRLRNLSRSFEVRLELIQTDQGRREALGTLAALHAKRWQRKGGSEAFGTAALRSFYDEMSRLALERGWLRLFVLRLSGTPVAVLHGYRYGRTFYFYQTAFDPAFGSYSVGLVTMGLTIRYAIEEGAAEYDLLQGAEPYKFQWAHGARDRDRLELFPSGLRGTVYRDVAAASRRIRRLAGGVSAGTTASWVSYLGTEGLR